ncbi:hypothetical protein [Bdellovibrio svalbardensis]|uniref:Peptidase M48 domain-containing protein n=1 Tax=Bdellovibrio svalbardensis TaxID=2972972 RepID=A0ABT6DF72_9BACT|nr:hypothetical protein [Bdellovibrio svalbardensis]MDG0815117.1 hypothetical protein [Bdellovibrio svalbardensis]
MKHLAALVLSLTLSLLFISFSAQASNCSGVNGAIKDVVFLAQPNCDLAEGVSIVVNEIAKTFGGPNITVIMGSVSNNASFDLGHLIELPYQMIFYGQYGASYPMSRVSVITSAAHEYGHAIFHERVKKEFPDKFGDLAAKFAKVSDLKEAVARGKATSEQLSKAALELAAAPAYADFSKYLTAYSEFYADVITVFNFESKSAMLKALYYDQMSDNEYYYVRTRDFDSKPSSSHDDMLSEDHAKLAYVRAYVGEFMWPENREQARVYADKILSAIMVVAKEDIKSGRSPEFKEMSDRLIAELKKP